MEPWDLGEAAGSLTSQHLLKLLQEGLWGDFRTRGTWGPGGTRGAWGTQEASL